MAGSHCVTHGWRTDSEKDRDFSCLHKSCRVVAKLNNNVILRSFLWLMGDFLRRKLTPAEHQRERREQCRKKEKKTVEVSAKV